MLFLIFFLVRYLKQLLKHLEVRALYKLFNFFQKGCKIFHIKFSELNNIFEKLKRKHVSLQSPNNMDISMTSTKRSGIPVSTTPTKSRLNRNGSKSSEDSLYTSPANLLDEDLDSFTLLEENITLKETKKHLLNRNLDSNFSVN